MRTRKLVDCPCCETRPETSKSSCLLVAEHTGKYDKVDAVFVATGGQQDGLGMRG